MYRKLLNRLILNFKRGLAFCVIVLVTNIGVSQKLNFVNYSIEQGLAQSQPQVLTQDHYGFIWVATLGGISRFDGKEFVNYYRKNGLESQAVYSLLHLKESGLYIGHQNGLQVYNGRSFETCHLEDNIPQRPIIQILEFDSEKVYALNSEGTLLISNDHSIKKVEKFKTLIFRYVCRSRNEALYGVTRNGIYDLSKTPKLVIANSNVDEKVQIQKIFFDNKNNLWLLTNQGLYLKKGSNYSKVISTEKTNSHLTSIAQDSKSRIWVGTTKGAFLIDLNETVKHIGSKLGLTDNTINDIMLDRENNLWFAADAEGVFKLSPNVLESFDITNGLSGNVVMALAKDDMGTIWTGTTDGGLSMYSNGEFKNIYLPSKKVESQKINALFYDSRSRLWIGTLGGGLWIKEKNVYKQIGTSEDHNLNSVISISEDDNNNVWITTPSGLFYYDNNTVHKINGIEAPCFSVFQKSKDSLLVGSTEGLFRVIGKSKASKISIKNQNIGTINCFLKFGRFIVLGTEDEGLLFWDPKNNTVTQCSSEQGLNSDFIFSLYQLDSENILVGTGKGISKVNMDDKSGNFRVENFSSTFNPYGPECNLNAVLESQEGKIWIGTTKGIYIYNSHHETYESNAPLVYLNSVALFSKNKNDNFPKDTLNAWSVLPKDVILPYTQNHITFDFNGVYFSDSNGLEYKYRLFGVDTAYAAAVSTSKVIYPNLKPGSYRFQAKAITDNGVESSNQIDFPFIIESPFYQKTWFTIMIGGMLILLGFLLHYARIYNKEKQLVYNQKIRLEEQQKILERTSEDLHDDLGNKITRITVLTDVLQRKMSPDESEKLKLVNQIRENAQALYFGTKDIIWSMTPGNNNLYDTLEKCRLEGMRLFEDTNIEFIVKGLTNELIDINVPMPIGRNLNLITKEAFSNILRHSEADKAIFQVDYSKDRDLAIEISDNGIGIQPTTHNPGHGLSNMNKRIERIGGTLKVYNNTNGGTSILLNIKIPPNEG